MERRRDTIPGRLLTAVKEVVSGLYQFTHGGVNVFVIDDGIGGVTLIDTGFPKHGDALTSDLASIGYQPGDLTNIVITHAHPDHLGNALRFSESNTPIHLHASGTQIAEAGIIHQTMKPAPGLVNALLFRLFIGSKPVEFPPFTPDRALADGDVLDIAGGLEVIHTPGHTASHVSLLWKKDRGLLFTGDAAANAMGLGYSLGYDDIDTGRKSLTKLAGNQFEAAVFGHGKPILSSAADRFAAKFGA